MQESINRQPARLFSNCPWENESNLLPKVKEAVQQKSKARAGLKNENLDVQDQLNNLINGFEYFGINFELAKDIFSEQSLTIHQEKAKCKKAYEENSFIQVSVNYLLNVIFGDKSKIKSESESLELYSGKWMNFSGKKKADREAVRQALITGDGYIHKIKGDKGSFKYRNIENSEDMYIVWNYKENRPEKFIERLYYTEAQAKKLQLKTYTIQMPYGTNTIVGIEYSPDEIIHYHFLENRWGMGYGRTPIASVLNDVSIINRMERSIAVISMYKAIPKKLLFPDTNNREEAMDDKEVNRMKKVLQECKDYESPVVGTKFSSLNLTDGGQALDLTPYLDYFKRKISMVLSPEFIVHGELVNRATSREQNQLFYLSVCSIRDEFYGDINDSISEGLIASLNVLKQNNITVPNETFYFEFGAYDVELVQDRMIRLMNEWNNGLITLNQYRENFDYSDDEEYGGLYKWETDAGASQTLNALGSMFNGQKANS